MRPHAIAEHVAKGRVGHREIVRALFEQNAARRIVPLLRVMRSAILHSHMGNENVAGVRDQNRVVRDVRNADAVNSNAGAILDENSVIRIDRGKRITARRNRHRPLEVRAIAVDRDSVQLDVAASTATQDGASMEVTHRSQNGLAAEDLEVVRAVGNADFGRDVLGTGLQVDCTRRGNRNRKENAGEDQTLF